MKYCTQLLLAAAVLGIIARRGRRLAAARKQGPAANDNLNAVLWDQTRGRGASDMTQAYVLARIRLDEALADKNWTADPSVQTGDFANKPPAVVLDVDDTVLNTSQYQAWNVKAGTSFSPKTWTPYVNSQDRLRHPGCGRIHPICGVQRRQGLLCHQPHQGGGAGDGRAAERARLPDGRQCRHPPHRQGARRTGARPRARGAPSSPRTIACCFWSATISATSPMPIKARSRSARKSSTTTRRIGARTGSPSPIPTYGSWESAAYGHDFKTPPEEQRQKKIEALKAWGGRRLSSRCAGCPDFRPAEDLRGRAAIPLRSCAPYRPDRLPAGR